MAIPDYLKQAGLHTFTEQAREFAARSLQQRIVLIDGERLEE